MGCQNKQSTPDREVRLGIVLYGGVSLAIYENGVAQEMFRAVKGEGVYSFIKQLIDSDIVVDIVSGTSAGGINGIMLGYALANDRDFKSSAKLWREDGDILRLLNDASAKNATSLLDSRGYYQERLQAAFEGMPVYLTPGNDGVDATCRVKSETSEFDLFVTGTDVQGSVFTVFDDRGQPIDVKTHRQMFQLSYRQDRKNEFDPADSAALAKLARITSCFPVAFEPVQVQPNKTQDAVLKRWGKLDSRDSMFFLDGGVLDNKPFSYTIDTIMRRTADRDVDRMLLYVEPDPERFTQTDLSETPNILQAGTAALISIPGYQSIAGDLQNIAAHNDRVNGLMRLLQPLIGIEERAAAFRRPDPDGGLNLIEDDDRRKLYRASRLVQLRDRAVNGMLNNAQGRMYMRSHEQRHAAKLLVEAFENWQGDGTDTLGDFDVYFRMRRLMHMAYFIMSKTYPPGGEECADKAQYQDLWRRLNHQFKLLEIIQYAMERSVDESKFEWAKVMNQGGNVAGLWEQAKAVLFAVLDTSDIQLNAGTAENGKPGDLKQERNELAAYLNRKLRGLTATPATGNLLKHCDDLEWTILQSFAPGEGTGAAAREYARFAIVDSFRYPLQRAAGTDSMDTIRTVRISPIDAKRAYSALTLNEKLCGNELGHFGGFLKRSWRANDTMWGRLDAVCQLVECLVTPDRIDKVSQASLENAREFPLDLLFPNASSVLRSEIRDALNEIIDRRREQTDRNDRFERFWNALTRAAQAEILNEEVPRVVDAAIRQQADWNQFSLSSPKLELLSKRTVWTVGRRRLDSALAAYASSRLTAAMEKPGEWPSFFESIYAVGSEAWNNDIPKPILLEIGTGAGLVLKNCLMCLAGKHATRWQKFVLNGVYFPLLVTNRLVRIQRTMPEYTWVTLVTAFTLSVALLALEVFRSMVFGKAVPWPQWPWIAGPIAAASICVLLIFLIRVPVREINHPRDVRTALADYRDADGCEYCLVVNDPPWSRRYPGDRADGKSPAAPAPEPIVGPVENFYAQEDLPRQLHGAVLTTFGGIVAPDNVKGVQTRVETIRKVSGKGMARWILDHSSGLVVFDSYEGVVSLIIRLKNALSGEDLDQLKRNLATIGFWLAACDGGQTELKVVSREPRVFAYRLACKTGNSVACRSSRCTFPSSAASA